MSNDSNNKFQFVDIEDITEEKIEDSIEIVSSPDKVNVEVLDSLEEKKEEIKEESTTPVEVKEEDNTIEVSKKKHFSFEARIVVSVISILVLFVCACFMGLRVINHTTTENVSYVENGDFSYQVCLKNATCEPENVTYNGNDINIIKIVFDYDSKFAKKIDYNKKYRVSSVISVYSKNNSNNLLYEKENDLVDRTELIDNGDNIHVNEVVVIDYSKYKDIVKKYEGEDRKLEVILYLEEGNETRKISSLSIPLTNDSFELTKYTTANANRYEKLTVNVWDNYSLVYGIATSFLTLISLILIYRTTRLVLKVTNNKSEYEQTIDDILREYDSIIVIARDGYESTDDKEIKKIESFKELLEIKDRLNKPIIFSTVNDVKCEFIVEGESELYKYTMKEADFIN
jgi:hypothetical protein